MRTAVHPNCSGTAVRPVNRVGNDLPGIDVVDLTDAYVARLPAHRIGHDMRNALPFVSCENSFIPTFRFISARFINRQPRVVSDLDTLPMVDILVCEIAPLPG